MKSGGEAWLQKGIGYAADDKCPYCGQGLKGLALVKTYQQVFSEEYEQLKASALASLALIERDFGDRASGVLSTLIEANSGAAEFWGRYCTIPVFDRSRRCRSCDFGAWRCRERLPGEKNGRTARTCGSRCVV
jgi:hypothetical protein